MFTVLKNTAYIKKFSVNPGKLANKVGVASDMKWQCSHLILGWISLLMDSPCDQHKPFRTVYKFYNEFTTSGLITVIARYSDLFDIMANTGHKSNEGDLTVIFIPEMKNTPIFREYLHWYRTGDPETLTFINTFLRFGKKCEFENEEFNARAFRSWLEVEESLADNVQSPLVDDLSKIVYAILPQFFSAQCFMGKNGSGAVAGDERGNVAKARALVLSPKLKRLLSLSGPLRTRTKDSDTWIDRTCFSKYHSMEPTELSEVSRLMFVPKNYKTSRSICMEPTSFMYFQQHVRWELEHAISKSVLGSFIKIDDQGWNKEGALYGSKTGLVDTIDLSRASDSVPTDLVRRLFPKHWRHLLLSTRTSKVLLPNDEVVSVKKFAPMGSALCFPVQSVIYCTVVLYAYMLHELGPERISDFISNPDNIEYWIRTRVSRHWQSNSSYESIGVYGDDIICDSRTTGSVIQILRTLGFEVNSSKSFFNNNPFRESCGIFAWNGEDVTPLHFNAKVLKDSFDANSYVSYISLANAAGDYGYRSLQRFLTNRVLRHGASASKLNPVGFSSRIDRGNTTIYSHTSRNTHVRHRVSDDLQRDEYRVLVERPRSSYRSPGAQVNNDGDLIVNGDVADIQWEYEQYSYDLNIRATRLRGSASNDFVTPRVEYSGTKLGWGWIPA